MLTARQTDQDVIGGFGNGADDYITKPFNMQILAYRVRAVLRRARSEPSASDVPAPTYRLGSGVYSVAENQIVGTRRRVRLTRTEGKILLLLLANQGQILGAERILERVWGYDAESHVSVIKTHIRHVRTKIAAAIGDEQVIRTVQGMGYTLR
jgi:two-component system alkaline phosphatase synthesis response regulator PhoP